MDSDCHKTAVAPNSVDLPCFACTSALPAGSTAACCPLLVLQGALEGSARKCYSTSDKTESDLFFHFVGAPWAHLAFTSQRRRLKKMCPKLPHLMKPAPELCLFAKYLKRTNCLFT